MHHPLRCRCGALTGSVRLPAMADRATCYCKDCQAYARYLGQAGTVLDDHGGTERVPVLPHHLQFDVPAATLACMSLSPDGLLRWFAACCNTPVVNTPRNHKVPYASLVHACLAREPSLDASFGPPRVAVNTESAAAFVQPTPFRTALTVVRVGAHAAAARVARSYRHHPLFDARSGTPIRAPQVIDPAERARLTPMRG